MSLSPFDSLFDLTPSRLLLETEDFMGLERARVMAVDFVEDREGFQIKADIPGVEKKDIKLDMDHNVLTISAKRSSGTASKPQKASTGSDTDSDAKVTEGDSAAEVVQDDPEDKMLQQDANVLRYERFDSFQARSFRVPQTADLSTISAKYENGVLTVNMKKRQDVIEERRTVDIA